MCLTTNRYSNQPIVNISTTFNFFNFILNYTRESGSTSSWGVDVEPKSPAPDATVVCRYRGERMRADLRTISHVQPPQVTSLQPYSALKRHYLHFNNLISENNVFTVPVIQLCLLIINHFLKIVIRNKCCYYRSAASCLMRRRHTCTNGHNSQYFP